MKAWVDGLRIEQATDVNASEVREILEEKGFTFSDWECNWERIGPHWLICRSEGAAVGCIQVCLGLPFGRLEFLCIRDGHSRLKRAYLLAMLLTAGEAVLREYGSCAFQCLIGDADGEEWAGITKNRGIIPIIRGVIAMKVIR